MLHWESSSYLEDSASNEEINALRNIVIFRGFSTKWRNQCTDKHHYIRGVNMKWRNQWIEKRHWWVGKKWAWIQNWRHWMHSAIKRWRRVLESDLWSSLKIDFARHVGVLLAVHWDPKTNCQLFKYIHITNYSQSKNRNNPIYVYWPYHWHYLSSQKYTKIHFSFNINIDQEGVWWLPWKVARALDSSNQSISLIWRQIEGWYQT